MSLNGGRMDDTERRYQDSLRSGIRDFDGFDTKLEEQSRTRNGDRNNGSPKNKSSLINSDSKPDIPQRGMQGQKGKFQSVKAPYRVDSPKYQGSDDGYHSAKEEAGLSPRGNGNKRQNGRQQKGEVYKTSPYFMEEVNLSSYKREGVAGTPRQQGQGRKFQPTSLKSDAGPQESNSRGNKTSGYQASWETSRSMPQLGGGKARQGERPEDQGKGAPFYTDDSQVSPRSQEKTFVKGHQGKKIQWQDISNSSPYCYWDQQSSKADVPKLWSPGALNGNGKDSLNGKEMTGNERKAWNKSQYNSPREKPSLQQILDTCDRGTQTSIIAVDDEDWPQESNSEDIQSSNQQNNFQNDRQNRSTNGKVTSMFAPNDVFGVRSEGLRA